MERTNPVLPILSLTDKMEKAGSSLFILSYIDKMKREGPVRFFLDTSLLIWNLVEVT